jgi:uncharacterized membrane protein YedE/YeeE
MPLNDNEQKILEEIERRLSEEDPRLVEQVSRTDLHRHAWGRMKMAIAGFVVGLLLILLVGLSPWIAAGGFVLMTLSALLAYRYAGRLGDDSVAPGTFGGIAARVAGRLRRPAPGRPPEE